MSFAGQFDYERGVATNVTVCDSSGKPITIMLRTFPADLRKTGCPAGFAINAAILVSMWCSLLGDSPLNDSHGLKPERLVRAYHRHLHLHPITGTVNRLTSLADSLLDNISGDLEHGYIVHWVDEFRDTPIFKEYHEFVRTGDPELLAYILTFLQLGKRVEAEFPELEAIAFRKWLEDEERLTSWDAVYERYGTFDESEVPMLDIYTDPSVAIDEIRCLAHHLIPDTWTSPFLSGQVRIRRCIRTATEREAESQQLFDAGLDFIFFCGNQDCIFFSSSEGCDLCLRDVNNIDRGPQYWDIPNALFARRDWIGSIGVRTKEDPIPGGYNAYVGDEPFQFDRKDVRMWLYSKEFNTERH